MKKLFPILMFLSGLILVFLFVRLYQPVFIPFFPNPLSELQEVHENTVSPANSTFFQEMTIPFLRQKVYQSTLENEQFISTNAAYDSYLTSYDSDGLRINALLTRPKGDQPEGGWPAVVFIHGYIPPTLYRTQEKYVQYVDALAKNGFVVLKIDLRGHGQSEGQASGAYYSGDYIADTLNAYAALQSSSFVNPQRVGLWGHSMAGNIVLRSLAVRPTIPAAVIWAGAVYTYEDFQKYKLNDLSYRPPELDQDRQKKRTELAKAHGEFEPTSAFWKEVAPTNYLNEIKSSIAVHHAEDDQVVSINYTRDLEELLSKTQVPHQVFEYKQGGHNISGASFTLAMQRTLDFFTETLVGNP